MTDAELLDELQFLGIDQARIGLVALLPLVDVAWADGRIQPAERELILRIARRRHLVDARSRAQLEGWLSETASEWFHQRGRKVLRALAERGSTPGFDLTTLRDVVGFCQGVAEAAGGVLGLARVCREERRAIAEISRALDVDEHTPWAELERSLGADLGTRGATGSAGDRP